MKLIEAIAARFNRRIEDWLVGRTLQRHDKRVMQRALAQATAQPASADVVPALLVSSTPDKAAPGKRSAKKTALQEAHLRRSPQTDKLYVGADFIRFVALPCSKAVRRVYCRAVDGRIQETELSSIAGTDLTAAARLTLSQIQDALLGQTPTPIPAAAKPVRGGRKAEMPSPPPAPTGDEEINSLFDAYARSVESANDEPAVPASAPDNVIPLPSVERDAVAEMDLARTLPVERRECGVLVSQGEAENKGRNGAFVCFTAQIRKDDGQIAKLYGVDLERALASAQVKLGDRIVVTKTGAVPVEVVKGGRRVEAHKNLWYVERAA